MITPRFALSCALASLVCGFTLGFFYCGFGRPMVVIYQPAATTPTAMPTLPPTAPPLRAIPIHAFRASSASTALQPTTHAALALCPHRGEPRRSQTYELERHVRIAESTRDAEHWAMVRSLYDTANKADLNIHNPAVDQYISGSLRQSAVWEAPIVEAMKGLLGGCTHGQLFVDVGANIAYFSLIAHLSGCRVISFEPMHYNVVQIERTMARLLAARDGHSLQHWQVYNNAVSDVTANVVKLQTTNAHLNAGNHKIGAHGDPAYTVRLDDVVRERVTLMKVDVEGYEAYVVAGGSALFCTHRVDAIILEMTQDIQHSGCNVKAMLDWFTCLGYEMRSLQRPRGPAVRTQGSDTNMLLVRATDAGGDCTRCRP